MFVNSVILFVKNKKVLIVTLNCTVFFIINNSCDRFIFLVSITFLGFLFVAGKKNKNKYRKIVSNHHLEMVYNGQRLELLGGWPPAALSAVKNIINLGKVSVSAKQPQ